jgi:DNA-binding NarL/FixJ family response regulator
VALLGPADFDSAREAGRQGTHAEALAEMDAALTGALAAGTEPGAEDPHRLTPRELDVLRLLVQGKTDQEIADTLYLSRRTVTTHTSNMFAKLGVSNRVEATALAMREGLL